MGSTGRLIRGWVALALLSGVGAWSWLVTAIEFGKDDDDEHR